MSDDVMARIGASEDLIHNAGHGRLELLRGAIARGGDVNYLRSDQGPVMLAVKGRHLDCALLLLDSGGNPNQRTRVYWTALHEAGMKDFAEFIEPLVTAGARIDAQDGRGASALFVAAQFKSGAAVKRLLACGASVNLADYDGVTPLMAAVGTENETIVSVLLAAGADPGLTNRAGQSALDMAQAAGWAAGKRVLAQPASPQGQPAAPNPSAAASAPSAVPAAPVPTPSPDGISRIGKRPSPR